MSEVPSVTTFIRAAQCQGESWLLSRCNNYPALAIDVENARMLVQEGMEPTDALHWIEERGTVSRLTRTDLQGCLARIANKDCVHYQK